MAAFLPPKPFVARRGRTALIEWENAERTDVTRARAEKAAAPSTGEKGGALRLQIEPKKCRWKRRSWRRRCM